MKNLKYIISLAAFFLPIQSSHENICHLLPKNNLKITTETFTGISKSEFEEIISEFLKMAEPLAEEQGYKLTIKNKWEDETVNASTLKEGKKWIINAYGGLARYQGMDPDTYMLVMLHELGHHLGGYPKKSWASSEGASDYYATLKGMRYIMSKGYMPNVSLESVPALVKSKCSILHKTQQDIHSCMKISVLGGKLANILNSLADNPKIIDFNTPDKSEVTKSYDGHPNAQCRMDTYFAGAICNASFLDPFSNDSPIVGSCAEEKGDKWGYRPHCWYKPNL